MTELSTVELRRDDGATRPARFALPAGDGPCPAVLIIHDIFGLTADTDRQVRRFAEAGYAALAPGFYDNGSPLCVVRTLMSMGGLGDAPQTVAAGRCFLAEQDRVDPASIGVIGFCMGGGFALLAGADESFAVAAPFYGTVPAKAERLTGLCPTVAFFGAQDAAFRPHARRLEAHFETIGSPHEVHVYDDAGHSFMNDHRGAWHGALPAVWPMRARYVPDAEARAFARVLAFFSEQLPTPPAV